LEVCTRFECFQVKEGDNEYFPATYASCERDDYILSQAPTKENYRDFWRMVWRDGCKILVSLSDKLSDTDAKLCYPYWPKKEGEKMDIDGKRFIIECQKKTDFKGYAIYDLGLASTDPSMDASVAVGKKSSAKDAAPGADEATARPVTLMHYENWDSDTWPDLDSLGPFVQSLSKREIQVMRKSLDNYIPPVVIQSHDGLGRAPIVWVSTILMKDIEKKECFDVEDLARKCARSRPGALHKKIHFCILIALAFRLSSLGGWTPLSDARAKIKEIEEAYHASLKK
ncbi:Protein-tyrosine phosphatase, partial [Oesophagostomum dentatum]